uniref:EamA family transporter n=1 Tax=candidate division WOR-3 bacterium TaxID=2052148 RepID=A0A7C4GGJ0_UNCW3
MDYRILAILALILWGIWGYMSRVLIRDGCPPGTFAFWATLVGLLPVAALALATDSLRLPRQMPLVALAGAIGGIATACFYFALRRGPASVVVPISGMYILIPALLGLILLREPLTWKHLAGLASAALAVIFLSL